MKIVLREDPDPDPDFYYQAQFRIYHEPYLIWDRDTWEEVIGTCDVYRIEVNGMYAGDVILEERGGNSKYIVDFSLLPEYQGKGIGKQTLEWAKKMGREVTAVTRKETLEFFKRSGFTLKKKMKNYYEHGVDGYLMVFSKKL
jgi:GNAT superfamily N-acetyltransferase